MVCAFCAFYIWVFLIVSTGFSPPEIGYFNRLHSNVVFVVGNWAGFKRWSIACSAGVFVLELAVVSSPPYWLSAQLPLPGTRFCLSPSLFRVWIQDGAHLIKCTRSRPRQNTPALQATWADKLFCKYIFLDLRTEHILKPINLTTYYHKIIRFIRSFVQSVAPRIPTEIIRVDLFALGVIHACEWPLRNPISPSSVLNFKEYLIPVYLVS